MNILNLDGWNVTAVDDKDHTYHITAEINTPPDFCRKCGCLGNFDRFGTRTKTIADTPIHGKKVFINVVKQRFRCKECRFTFTVSDGHVDEKRRVTKRLADYIKRESFKRTFTGIANEIGVDDETIRNVFRDHVKGTRKYTYLCHPEMDGN